MLVRKLLLLSGIAVLTASSVSAQGKKEKKGKGEENTEAEAKPAAAPSSKPTGLQWSNRDMTYHGQNYDILDSAYYGKGKPKTVSSLPGPPGGFPSEAEKHVGSGIWSRPV